MNNATINSSVDFRLEEGQCIGCAICVDVCPADALKWNRQSLLPAWVARVCTGCRECELECPTAAIHIRM